VIDVVSKETYKPFDLGYLGISKLFPEHYVMLVPKKAKSNELSELVKELRKAHS